ncbi:kinase-like domain-containing protein [Biscogniauxia sp. FL1348]|nr:kinase-like domain-containing protein [Biscogniauxia sp. FL1348]
MDYLGHGSPSKSTRPKIPGQDTVSPRAAQEAQDMLKRFAQVGEKRFQFERIIGEGSAGVTFKMKMKEEEEQPPSLYKTPSSKTPVRRFVMKRSLNAQAERNLKQEIEVLKRFSASMHISRPFYVDDGRLESTISYMDGPTLLTEWIEGGLLYDFIQRLGDREQPLPNRMLWRLFLCFCRFLVAMAWPPDGDGSAAVIETIPKPNANGVRPPMSRLLHGDLNHRNVMIDAFESIEHSKVPLLKLIDFGGSRDLPASTNQAADLAVKTNMLYIGQIMLTLVGGSHLGGSANMQVTINGEEKTVRSYARDLDGLNPSYKAPPALVARHKDKMDNLDPRIRSLVARCCALSSTDRPDIVDLLDMVEEAVRTTKKDYYSSYKYFANESDEALERLSRELLLNADSISSTLASLTLGP